MKESPEFELEWLKHLADEPSQAEIAALRARVLNAVSAKSRARWPWLWSAAAALVLITLLMLPKRRAPVSVALEIRPEPALERVAFTLGNLPNVTRRSKVKRPEVAVVAPSEGMPVARLQTSDPNIVVLWVLNTNSRETSTND